MQIFKGTSWGKFTAPVLQQIGLIQVSEAFYHIKSLWYIFTRQTFHHCKVPATCTLLLEKSSSTTGWWFPASRNMNKISSFWSDTIPLSLFSQGFHHSMLHKLLHKHVRWFCYFLHCWIYGLCNQTAYWRSCKIRYVIPYSVLLF